MDDNKEFELEHDHIDEEEIRRGWQRNVFP